MPAIVTARDAELVQRSYESLRLKPAELGAAFYGRLFADHPAVRALFPSDMSKQTEHISVALALVARNSARLDDLSQPLRDMGARHVRYGAKPEHYPVVRDTLIAVLAEHSGPAWSSDLSRAWAATLTRVAEHMIAGAEAAERGQAPTAAISRR